MELKANSITLQTIAMYSDSLIHEAKSVKSTYKVKNLKTVSGEDVIVEFEFFNSDTPQVIKYKKKPYPLVEY
ncbi:hypothetical protein E9993_22360 [Labilibacter sediminis]|nr:hypothetical protein E9993_22360 [Labilibacter sediminis]